MEKFSEDLEKLRKLPNCTRIVLSFDNENIKNYDNVKNFYGSDGIQFAFTGELLDWTIQTEFNGRKFGIFFNISKKAKDIKASKKIKQTCPALANKLAHSKACSVCNRCWRSSKTKGEDWNEYIF